jgi:membrane protease YdiL (CAAX protease family)
VALAPSAVAPPDPAQRMASSGRYALAVGGSVLIILSQYYLPLLAPASLVLYQNVLTAVAIAYVAPALLCLALLGSGPLRGATSRMGTAAVQALSWYGLLSLLALAIVFALTVLYTLLDPSALSALTKQNPVLHRAQGNPAFWIGFSFVAGGFEELIFRGFFFGYWLQRSPGRWGVHAGWTSALFGAVHLYYGFTYLAVSPIFFVSLFLTGFAFAAAVRDSGGNLVVVALLHGAADATAFLFLVSPSWSYALHYGLILVGALVGLVAYLLRRPKAPRLLAEYPYRPPPFLSATGGSGPPGGPPPPPPPEPLGSRAANHPELPLNRSRPPNPNSRCRFPARWRRCSAPRAGPRTRRERRSAPAAGLPFRR